jgi:hypothetical protein
MALPTYGSYGSTTDYSTPCGMQPLSLLQMLAQCVVGTEDIAGVTHYRLNLLPASAYCDDYAPYLTCDNVDIDPERILVENIFAIDECGMLGIKVLINHGTGLD